MLQTPMVGAQVAASLAVSHPARVAALVCGGEGPCPDNAGRRERLLAAAGMVTMTQGG